MADDLGHAEGCGCAVCRKRRDRLASDPRERELEATRAEHDQHAPEPVEQEPEQQAVAAEPESRQVVVHEHHHHERHVTEKHQHRHEHKPRHVRRDRKVARKHHRHHSWLRFFVVGAVLLWVLHSFYPDLNVPLVPGVACTNGTSGQVVAASYTAQNVGLGGKLKDLVEESIGTAAKKLVLLTVGTALHVAGATIKEMLSHPPSPADIRDGLIHDAETMGHVVGFVVAAFTGKSVDDLSEMSVPPGSAAVSATGCGTSCPGAGAVPAAGRARDGVDTAARAALRAGWTGGDAVTAVAVAGAESGWRHDAANRGSSARGMWQTMMSYHAPKYHGASWADPYANARVSHQIWADAGGWTPWVTYTNGAYRGYLKEARAAVGRLGTAANIVPVALLTPTATFVDGKRVSTIAARQLRLAERVSGIDLRVMQGGYGGDDVAASGKSHDYPGVVDVSPGTIAVERVLREVGFAAWARNVPGRSSVGTGAHVHAVSLLDVGDKTSPQVFGSWAHHGNGLSGVGNDPAPHPAWLPNLAQRVGGVSLVENASARC